MIKLIIEKITLAYAIKGMIILGVGLFLLWQARPLLFNSSLSPNNQVKMATEKIEALGYALKGIIILGLGLFFLWQAWLLLIEPPAPNLNDPAYKYLGEKGPAYGMGLLGLVILAFGSIMFYRTVLNICVTRKK